MNATWSVFPHWCISVDLSCLFLHISGDARNFAIFNVIISGLSGQSIDVLSMVWSPKRMTSIHQTINRPRCNRLTVSRSTFNTQIFISPDLEKFRPSMLREVCLLWLIIYQWPWNIWFAGQQICHRILFLFLDFCWYFGFSSVILSLQKYMIPLKVHSIIENTMVDDIFYKVPELLNHHAIFLDFLERAFLNWDTDTTVGQHIRNTVRDHVKKFENSLHENFRCRFESLFSSCTRNVPQSIHKDMPPMNS